MWGGSLGSKMQLGTHVQLPFPTQHRISGIVDLLMSDELLFGGRMLTANLEMPSFEASQAHEQTFCEQCHRALLS